MTTIAEFAETWPERFGVDHAESTRRTKASMIRPFVEEFGERPLDGVPKGELHDWGREHPNRVRYVKLMYADAVSVELCPSNPIIGLRVRGTGGRRDLVPLTPRQLNALVRCEPRDLKGAVMFSARTGIRLGELLAVTADAIDGDVLDVRCQLDPRGEERPCKAGSKGRVIIPPDALKCLPRARTGRLWPLSRSAHHRLWDSCRRCAEIDFPWHGLRHQAATWLFERGASLDDVAWQLRHRQGSITASYVHARENVMVDRLREIVR